MHLDWAVVSLDRYEVCFEIKIEVDKVAVDPDSWRWTVYMSNGNVGFGNSGYIDTREKAQMFAEESLLAFSFEYALRGLTNA